MGHGELDVLERQLEARDPDVRLMLQVRDDTPAAFEALVQRYQDRLVGILYHLVGNLEEAEDLTQDAFLRVYKSRKGYRPRAKFSTWLFTIANNLALNHLRRKGRSFSFPMGGVSDISGSGADRPATPIPGDYGFITGAENRAVRGCSRCSESPGRRSADGCATEQVRGHELCRDWRGDEPVTRCD